MGRFFIAWQKRAGRLRTLRVRIEGLSLWAQPAPILHLLPLRGNPARRGRAFVVQIRFGPGSLLRYRKASAHVQSADLILAPAPKLSHSSLSLPPDRQYCLITAMHEAFNTHDLNDHRRRNHCDQITKVS